MKKTILFTLNFLCIICLSINTIAQHNPDFEEKMLELVNELRSQNGVPPVVLNTHLNTASRDHSQDMADNNYFSHTGQNGSNFSERAQNAGYQGSPAGENIAAGNSSPENTFNQWVNSQGHFNNMVNPNVNEMGIGYGYNSQAQYRHYWTQVFGYDNTLSIDSFLETKKEIVLYPNPTKENIYVSLQQIIKKKLDLKIYDINGKLVYNHLIKNNQDNFEISLSNLPNGLYYMQLDNFYLKKIVKI